MPIIGPSHLARQKLGYKDTWEKKFLGILSPLLTMDFVAYPATPDFHKFMQHVRRNLFRRDSGAPPSDTIEVAPVYLDLETQTFLGTIKLHGTNASIRCRSVDGSDPTFQYQSRNKIITSRDDNAGCAAFLSTIPLSTLINEILRIRKIATFEEIFIVGEWAGTGIQKGVAIASLERFFAIFNIQIDGHWVDMREYKTVHLPEKRIYNIANFPTYEVSMNLDDAADRERAFNLMKSYTLDVTTTCPVGAELFQVEDAKVISKKKKNTPNTRVLGGEGIVWTLVPKPPHDTNLLNFKTKGEQFLAVGRKAAEQRPLPLTNPEKVAAFVDYALGEGRLEQGLEYLQEMGHDPNDMTSLGEYMKWVMGDVIKEEGWRLHQKENGEPSLVELGVTEADVKKLVGARARQWFMDRKSDVSTV